MKVKRPEQLRESDRRRPVRQPARGGGRRTEQAPPRKRRPGSEQRPARTAPATGPIQRPGTRPARPKSTSQAKARAKARKAKAPKVVRPPLRVRLRERLLVRLASIELNPRVLFSRVPVRRAGDRGAGPRPRGHPVAVHRIGRAVLPAGPRPPGQRGPACNRKRRWNAMYSRRRPLRRWPSPPATSA